MKLLNLVAFFLINACIVILTIVPSITLHAENYSSYDYTLGPEDVIEIKVWDNDDLNLTVEISQEGSFTFPLIGTVKAQGLSVLQLEKLIRDRLSDGYIMSPQVNIYVNSYRTQKVFVLGQVKNPGVYNIKSNIYLLELISMAGGFTDQAEHSVTIVRSRSSQNVGEVVSRSGKQEEIYKIDLGEFKEDRKHDAFVIKNGDYIYVNKKSRFFITGQVMKTGDFAWEKDLTVRQALSLAGGTTTSAAEKHITIIRVKNEKEVIVKVKMEDLVEPNDVIQVPERLF
ncbi:MAG: polysaccharide export protein [Candidatus Scalindua sp.]|nr:polysaccharide export protein [Candidatus Scalindua sp.]